ncbi:DUF2242 domain-containing protein [Denitratisoma oestradiolicum]|uniref:DUF2242 domain-containing protein n=1 Tax=Denitratisoma oestradiolicum TaxID=311182 RepID=A0A6S6XYP4_9PROT|nr:DUF2242 domain-containing protein [Denitratisoma oestradiolicum]TWO79380.1 hypothetical protein CBW56_15255 [Denitratisoma oestradiolicum]CAB1367992.1 conserved exported protein of unknown function [Denitratisoma oestradiolicum]
MPTQRCLSLILGCLAAGCAAPSPPLSALSVYPKESFGVETPFEYRLEADNESACEAGRRALLSQGYQVEQKAKALIQGQKAFQPSKEHHTRLEINLVCLAAEPGAVVYANAKQTYFELKASNTSAGLSVTGMGSISLPWVASSENMIKVGEETVSDGDFYRRLFILLSHHL